MVKGSVGKKGSCELDDSSSDCSFSLRDGHGPRVAGDELLLPEEESDVAAEENEGALEAPPSPALEAQSQRESSSDRSVALEVEPVPTVRGQRRVRGRRPRGAAPPRKRPRADAADAGDDLPEEESDAAAEENEDAVEAPPSPALEAQSQREGSSDRSIALEAEPRRERATRGRESRRGDRRRRPRGAAPRRRAVAADQPSPTVSHRSPDEHCFEWAAIAMATLAQELGADMHRKLGQMAWTCCSHVSGLGTLEVALGMLRAAYPPIDRANLRAQTLYACEKAPSLRRILCSRFAGCVFTDVMGRMDEVDLSGLSFDDQIAAFRGVRVAPTAQCSKHGAWCPVPRADVDVSGSPCQPWCSATRGRRRGRHPFAHLILAWSAIMRRDRPPLAIHENVVGFRIGLLLQLLGDLYHIEQLNVEPTHAGFGFSRRRRRYFVLALRGRVATPSLARIYAILSARLRWAPGAWPSWIWGAGSQELLDEENARRQRRRLDALEAEPSTDWTYFLTAKQRGYLREYCRKMKSK